MQTECYKHQDYYTLLGLTPQAQTDEIKQAYRHLAKHYHPDVNAAPTANEHFRQIQEAYQVLSHPRLRRQYDILRTRISNPVTFTQYTQRQHSTRPPQPQQQKRWRRSYVSPEEVQARERERKLEFYRSLLMIFFLVGFVFCSAFSFVALIYLTLEAAGFKLYEMAGLGVFVHVGILGMFYAAYRYGNVLMHRYQPRFHQLAEYLLLQDEKYNRLGHMTYFQQMGDDIHVYLRDQMRTWFDSRRKNNRHHRK